MIKNTGNNLDERGRRGYIGRERKRGRKTGRREGGGGGGEEKEKEREEERKEGERESTNQTQQKISWLTLLPSSHAWLV